MGLVRNPESLKHEILNRNIDKILNFSGNLDKFIGDRQNLNKVENVLKDLLNIDQHEINHVEKYLKTLRDY